MPIKLGLLMLLSSFLLACGSPGSGDAEQEASVDNPTPPTQNNSFPFTSAHRGGAAYAPENTMMAFENAYRLGVEDIEMDAQLTADNVVVLLHDDTVDRTTDCSGTVLSMTLATLKNCDAAYWFSLGQSTTTPDENRQHPLRGQGVTVPSLAEVFAWYNALSGERPTLTIEIKNIPGEANFDPAGTIVAAALVAEIEAAGLVEQVIVQAFHPASIENVKLANPNIRTLFLSSHEVTGTTALQNLSYTVSRGHEFSAPNFNAPDLNAAYIALAEAAGKQVVPWTADRAEDIQQVADVGVHGVITNYPACSLSLAGKSLPDSVIAPALQANTEYDLCKS